MSDKAENAKRIRREMAESMKRRNRVDDDSDLVELVSERMDNDSGDYVELDMVNHPPHYKDESGIECIEVTKHMQFCGGNCFKYLYRAGKKGATIEDLKKSAWYAERAWIGNEVVADFLHIDIKYIASHRNELIGQAINAISESDWHEVYDLITKEAVRLEGLANDR